MEHKRRVYVLLLMSVVWAILIFVVCMMPSGRVPKVGIPYMDKVFHFGVFFVQSVLLSLLPNIRTKSGYFRIILLSTLPAFVYGGLIEILQSRYFGRTGEWGDLIADVAGGLAGAMAYPAMLKLRAMIFRKYK